LTVEKRHKRQYGYPSYLSSNSNTQTEQRDSEWKLEWE